MRVIPYMLRSHPAASPAARRATSRRGAPFDLICTLVRARLRGTAPPSGLAPHFARDPDADLAWAEIASRHRITPALARCVHDLGVASTLPASFRAYLDAIAAGNARRNRALRDQLREVVRPLNAMGIVPWLLKGTARLVDDLYPDDAWRFMVDLDLLLPPSRTGVARATLQRAGYVASDPFADGKPHHHEPPLLHPERVASVELHRHLQQRVLPVREIGARVEVRDTPLGRVGLLAPEDQVIHLLVHLQVEDGCWLQGTTRLRDLLELDLLAARYGSAIDWARVVARLSDAGLRSACLSAFRTAGTLLGTPLPEPLAAELDRAMRRATARVIRQEHSPSLMRIGLAYGWTARHLRRLLSDPQHRRHLIRGWRSGRVRTSFAIFRRRLQRIPS